MKRNWKHERLEDVFVLQMGKTPARQIDHYWNNGTNKWVSIADIGKTSKYIEKTKEQITDKAISESGIRQVPANTLIMSFKLSLGKVAITREPLYTNEAIMAFIDRGKYQLSLSYLFHLFKNKDWSDGTNKAVMGITLNKATLKDIVIPIPPLQEQEKIAKKLDAIYNLISIQEEQLRKLECLASSRFIEMFGDPIENPKGWLQKTISQVTKDIISGVCMTGESRPLLPGEKAVLKVSAVTYGFFKDDEYKVLPADYQPSKAISPQKGDLLFSRANTKEMVGATALVTKDYPNLFLPDKLWKIVFKDCINITYAKHFLSTQALRRCLSSLATGTSGSMYNISMKKLYSVPIMVPPLKLQDEFAAFIEQLDKSKVVGKMQRISLEKIAHSDILSWRLSVL